MKKYEDLSEETRASIERGLEDVRNGRVVSSEEARKQILSAQPSPGASPTEDGLIEKAFRMRGQIISRSAYFAEIGYLLEFEDGSLEEIVNKEETGDSILLTVKPLGPYQIRFPKTQVIRMVRVWRQPAQAVLAVSGIEAKEDE